MATNCLWPVPHERSDFNFALAASELKRPEGAAENAAVDVLGDVGIFGCAPKQFEIGFIENGGIPHRLVGWPDPLKLGLASFFDEPAARKQNRGTRSQPAPHRLQ